jgi:WD40 repeat protein
MSKIPFSVKELINKFSNKWYDVTIDNINPDYLPNFLPPRVYFSNDFQKILICGNDPLTILDMAGNHIFEIMEQYLIGDIVVLKDGLHFVYMCNKEIKTFNWHGDCIKTINVAENFSKFNVSSDMKMIVVIKNIFNIEILNYITGEIISVVNLENNLVYLNSIYFTNDCKYVICCFDDCTIVKVEINSSKCIKIMLFERFEFRTSYITYNENILMLMHGSDFTDLYRNGNICYSIFNLNGEHIKTIKYNIITNEGYRVTISQDGKKIAYTMNNYILVCDILGKIINRFKLNDNNHKYANIMFSPDGQKIVIVYNEYITIYEY